MHEWIDTSRCNIGISLEVVRRVEQRMRISPLIGSRRQEMKRRIDSGRGNVGVPIQVVLGAEERSLRDELKKSSAFVSRSADSLSPSSQPAKNGLHA
jgi:hypothetical protein